MNRKEQTKSFMMISNWLKPFGLHYVCKINSNFIHNEVEIAGAIQISR